MSTLKHPGSQALAGCLGEPTEDESLEQVGSPLILLLDVVREVATEHV